MAQLCAWYLATTSMAQAYGDRPWIVNSERVTIRGVVLPDLNLFGSYYPIDALWFTDLRDTTNVRLSLCRIDLSGSLVCLPDRRGKVTASDWKCAWFLSAEDTTRVLRNFARECALDVLKTYEAETPSAMRGCPPGILLQYLRAGDESLRGEAYERGREHSREAGGEYQDVIGTLWSATWEIVQEAAHRTASNACYFAEQTARRHNAPRQKRGLLGRFLRQPDKPLEPEFDAGVVRQSALDAKNSLLETMLVAAHEARK